MNYHLSTDAAQDLEDLYVYSVTEFGLDQAESYHQKLEGHFIMLTENPKMGRDYSFIKQHVRRSNCGSHAVYYRLVGINSQVLILRLLHQSQDPARHFDV